MHLELWITKFIYKGVDCMPSHYFPKDVLVEEFLSTVIYKKQYFSNMALNKTQQASIPGIHQ